MSAAVRCACCSTGRVNTVGWLPLSFVASTCCALDPHCLSPLTALHLGPISVRSWTRCWLAYINMYRGVSKYQIHMLKHNFRTFHSEVKVRLWLGLLKTHVQGVYKDCFPTTDLDICQFRHVRPRTAPRIFMKFCIGGGLLKFFQYPPVVCQNRTTTRTCTSVSARLQRTTLFVPNRTLTWCSRLSGIGFSPLSVKNKVSYTRFCPRKNTFSFGALLF